MPLVGQPCNIFWTGFLPAQILCYSEDSLFSAVSFCHLRQALALTTAPVVVMIRRAGNNYH